MKILVSLVTILACAATAQAQVIAMKQHASSYRLEAYGSTAIFDSGVYKAGAGPFTDLEPPGAIGKLESLNTINKEASINTFASGWSGAIGKVEDSKVKIKAKPFGVPGNWLTQHDGYIEISSEGDQECQAITAATTTEATATTKMGGVVTRDYIAADDEAVVAWEGRIRVTAKLFCVEGLSTAKTIKTDIRGRFGNSNVKVSWDENHGTHGAYKVETHLRQYNGGHFVDTTEYYPATATEALLDKTYSTWELTAQNLIPVKTEASLGPPNDVKTDKTYQSTNRLTNAAWGTGSTGGPNISFFDRTQSCRVSIVSANVYMP